MDSSRVFLLTVVAALLVLSVAMVLPFLQYFLLAALLAYVLWPLQVRLRSRVGDRVAAALLVVAATITLILPLVVVVRATAAEAGVLIRGIREGEITVGVFENLLRHRLGVEVDLAAAIRSATGDLGTGTFGSVLDVFATVTHAAVGLGLTLFLLYYFLRDGGALRRWLRETTPMAGDVQDDLYEEVDRIARAVLSGHVLIAIVQGVLAGLGLVAVGIPNATFWTAVMIVLSLLPVVGSFLVWGPAVVYLFGVGRPVAAAALFVYGAVIVGVSDDYLRPIVVDRYAQVNPSVIVLGVVGGLYVLGFMGIFVGPIVLGTLRAALDVFRENYTAVGGGARVDG